MPDGVGVIVGTTVSSARSFPPNVSKTDQTDGQGERSDSGTQTGDLRYKHQLDPEGIPQFGLVAEEVEKVNPDWSPATTKESLTPCATTP